MCACAFMCFGMNVGVRLRLFARLCLSSLKNNLGKSSLSTYSCNHLKKQFSQKSQMERNRLFSQHADACDSTAKIYMRKTLARAPR